MDGRRNRRGRRHSHSFTPPCPPERSMVNKFISSLQTYVVTASMIVLIYMIMEYHCKTCKVKYHDLQTISKSFDEIAVNLSMLNRNYQALEKKFLVVAQELPKMEGQIEILEALANTIAFGRYGWNPKTHLPLPNVDVYLSRPVHKIQNFQKQSQKNCTKTEYVQAA